MTALSTASLALVAPAPTGTRSPRTSSNTRRRDGHGRARHVRRNALVHRRPRSRPRAACARRTPSPARLDRRPPHASMFVAAGGQAIGFSTLRAPTTRSQSATHTITVTQASAAADEARRRRARRVDADRRHERHAQPRSQRHAEHAHARARHVHRDAARRRGARRRRRPAHASVNVEPERLGQAPDRDDTAKAAPPRCRSPAATRSAALQLSTDGAAHDRDRRQGRRSTAAPSRRSASIDVRQRARPQRARRRHDHRHARGRPAHRHASSGKNVSTGDGSLATVVATSTPRGTGVTATAVQVGLNTYRLQLTSNTAGANNGENVDAAAFNDDVGGFRR